MKDFFEPYVVAPYHCSSFCLCVMAAHGIPLNPQDKDADHEKLKELLHDLKQKIMGMADHVFHGDALMHNFVYDSYNSSLHFIDYNEGSRNDARVPRRTLNFNVGYPWLDALLYPNALLKVGKCYTKIQFAASTLLLLIPHGEDCHMEELMGKAMDLGNLLKEKDVKGVEWYNEKEVPGKVMELIGKVDELVDHLLGGYGGPQAP